MPLYEYELCDGDCKVCGGKFTLRRPLDAKELTNCPACKKPVRKLLSMFNSPKSLSFPPPKGRAKVYKSWARENMNGNSGMVVESTEKRC